MEIVSESASGETTHLRRYRRHLQETADWLRRSIAHGDGGSCASFSPLRGWSRPYPETSGYLIPTLIGLSDVLPGYEGEDLALGLGEWLLSIQHAEGWWAAGVHPPRRPRASVFHTAPVLPGLVALHELSGEARWLESGRRAGRWLAGGTGADGLWSGTDYRQAGTPSYYSFAAWPMLALAERADDVSIREAALRVQARIVERRRQNGSFERWGFDAGESAFTHTIAYTLQGLLETARLTDDWPAYGEPVEAGLRELYRRSGLTAGRLPGRLDAEWRPDASYVCLTGNAQVAICLLEWEARGGGDLRLVNIAARLLDAVCGTQRLRGPGALRGAVGGSSPIWGRYMVLRYPNWAAKFHCDALLLLIRRLVAEWKR